MDRQGLMEYGGNRSGSFSNAGVDVRSCLRKTRNIKFGNGYNLMLALRRRILERFRESVYEHA